MKVRSYAISLIAKGSFKKLILGKSNAIILLLMLILMMGLCAEVFAENIDLNNDGSQYAYGENVGWLNAEPSGNGGPGVDVWDSFLTGYIWAENIGWISLSCLNTSSCGTVNYGVINDGAGNLSGYAWSENVGWISFSCKNTSICGTVNYGIAINSTTGKFSGKAWGENIGWISFESTGPIAFGVTTSWRPNRPPVANNQSVTTAEDTSLGIILTGSDPDGNPLTYTVLSYPINGTLSGVAPNLTYAPNANFNGSDSFTFKVNDGLVDSSIATVSITVTAVNDAPVANVQSVTTPEDTARPITLTGSDVDGNPLSFSVVTQPTKGTLSGVAPNLTYTPNANFNGSDSFTFKVNDGLVDSNIAIVSITVTPVNDPPVANSQSVTTPEDTAKAIILTGSDVDGNPLTFSIVTAPTNGILSGIAPNLTYTPNANFNGSDSFTFKVNDGLVDSNIATVSITVTAVNDAPILDPIGSKTVNEGSLLTFAVSGSDVDGNPLVYSATGLPTGATFDPVTRTFTWTPDFTQAGVYNVTFTVSDGTLTDSEGVAITVNDVPATTTPSGTNVSIIPTPGVTLTFDTVTTGGTTTVTTSGTGQPPPSGFRLGSPPIYNDITTTATYSGPIKVCLTYDGSQFASERSLRLFHLESGAWVDITAPGYPDTTNNVICGTATSLSPFIIAEESSTAVTLQNISAHLDGNQIILTWSTSFEIDNEGFIILRAESPGGPFTPITQGMIPAMGGSGKATYTFTDSNIEQGKTYYYQLQDIDSRGRVTSHRTLPATVAFARGGGPSQESTTHEDITARNQQKTDVAIDKGSLENRLSEAREPAVWISVVESNNESKPTGVENVGQTLRSVPTSMPAEDAMAENRIPAGAPSQYDEKFQQGIESQRQTSPENLLDVRGHEVETQHPVSGSSSFSVSIEDDKGNIIMVKRLEDTANTSTPASDLEISEESGRMVLTWQGQGRAKGFILHRAEKGKDNYTPITSLIPYFGRDDKDIFLYRFTDNSAKPGVKYEYRLERVDAEHKPDLTIGKLSE